MTHYERTVIPIWPSPAHETDDDPICRAAAYVLVGRLQPGLGAATLHAGVQRPASGGRTSDNWVDRRRDKHYSGEDRHALGIDQDAADESGPCSDSCSGNTYGNRDSQPIADGHAYAEPKPNGPRPFGFAGSDEPSDPDPR